MAEIGLYEHNKTAYEKAEAMLAEDGRAAVIHPTGTGKSYIAFALAAAHPKEKFLWLAPSAYIYTLQADKLKKKQSIRFENIEFHTYAWIMHNEARFGELKPDYIVLDEFHRAGAAEWGRALLALTAMYPGAKLFGMSATNVRYLDNQRDMADELFHGAVASEMSLCEAMAEHILPEPKYVISVYSCEEKLKGYKSQAARLRNKKQRADAERLIEKLRRALQQADGLDRVFQKHLPAKDAKLIVFCANAEHMQEIMGKAREWFGGIDQAPHIYSVYTYNPDSEEDFQRFVEDDSGHLKLLYCIDMLNEGIHVDDVDAVVLCRPTVSPIVYRQQIGRAIAAGSKKRPVIFDVVNNFDNLYQIDALKEEFDELAQMYGRAGDGDRDDVEGFTVIDELRGCRELMEQIQRNLDSTWDIYYQELCLYVKKNGTVRVPRRYVSSDGLYLGRWLQRQKAIYNENKMPKTKIRQLESIGVEWESDSGQSFAQWVRLLEQYRDEHGDCAVPGRYVTEKGENLGNWCSNIRSRYRRGLLPKEREDILNRIGFVWETFGLYWEEGFRHAKEYFDAHGDLKVPKRYRSDDGFRLGLWIATQRSVRKGSAPGSLTEEKIARLDAIGMVWAGQKNDRFDRYLQAFQSYRKTYPDAVIPFSYTDGDGMQLGQWAARMNRQNRAGTLPEDKRGQLMAAGFPFRADNRVYPGMESHSGSPVSGRAAGGRT